MIDPDNPSRTVGTTSLVLGLLSVVPFGALAGVPAVVLALYALREEPRSRGRARAGALLGGLGIAMTVALILWVSFMVRTHKPSSPAAAGVDGARCNMYALRSSLEEWATGRGGAASRSAASRQRSAVGGWRRTVHGLRTCGQAVAGYNALSLEDTVTELLKKEAKTGNAREADLVGAFDSEPGPMANQSLLHQIADCFARTTR